MAAYAYSEDTLVQQTMADYLRDVLGWETVFAYNQETFGPEGTLGRVSDREVVLVRYLQVKLMEFNPGLPADAYCDAVRQLVESSAAQSLIATNRDKYALLKDGVQVSFRNEKGELVKRRLRIFDFNEPANNHFLAVRELWVKGDLYRRRADVVGFVNGIPLLFVELKNIHKDIRAAYEKNLADYKDTVPHLFHHNALIVIANGIEAKIGSITSRFEHFHEWKRLAEEEPGLVDMQTLLKGVCDKRNFMDLVENFIVFDDSSGQTVKIIARNHQLLGVNRAIDAVLKREGRQGKLGVFWHTQGAGKSYSMVFFTRKVHRKLGGNFTFLICTDRDDLDTQIYKTFAGCGLVDNDRDPCRAANGEHLAALLNEHKTYVFTLVQKFNKDIAPEAGYSLRNDIIVITDEAHRTQYGTLALNMRNALPNASYIGFTGTPLFKDDEITRRVFGDYVSTYDFQRAVEDRATVPLYYDARGDKLGVSIGDLNERIAAKLEEIDTGDINVRERLEKELKRDYHVITAAKRLDQIGRDFVEHYSTAWESGKAMFVCIDKVTCVRMYEFIDKKWLKRIETLEKALPSAVDEQEYVHRKRQIEWMRATRMAVVVSEEQGEVDKFRKWKLDITPHRKLIKDGFELDDGKRIDLDEAFKKADHPFRIAIVCAMWLTGFDVPSLSTIYLDKSLKAHTLMQAIARANRVNEGKNNGLIVDYCGILKNLRKALATFVGTETTGPGPGGNEPDPARPEEELLADLQEAVSRIDFERLRREFERSKAKRTTVQNLKEAIEKRLHILLERNPLRTDFQRHYEEIVGEYNREKDRLTIEKTFEDLLKFMQGLGEEEARHIREGLDEESLAVFDLLKKPDLGAAEIKRVKEIAVELLSTLKAERLKIDHWREKESTRDSVRIAIHDFLYSEATGLPISSYSEAEVGIKSENVFRHVHWAYPTVPSPYYGTHA
jgi:type I restriction enzyme R subunit